MSLFFNRPTAISVLICGSLMAVALPERALAADRVKIAIWGDSRENLDGAAERIASILLNEITDWDFMIHTGDFTSKGKATDWERSLAVPGMKRLFVKDRFLLCTSNHDSDLNAWDKFTKGVLPTNSADGSTRFYGFKCKNVHVVACDAYFTKVDAMQSWLDGYLKSVKPGEWIIGAWHGPSYANLTYKEAQAGSRGWLDSLYRHGGDFVVNGHAHVYLRTKPLRPDETIDEKTGIVHLVNGAGGASWKSTQPYVDQTAFTPAEKSFPTIVFLTIEGNKARVAAIDARPGKKLAVIDSVERTKNVPHDAAAPAAKSGPKKEKSNKSGKKRQPVGAE
jgi:predicted phosphodiesterase